MTRHCTSQTPTPLPHDATTRNKTTQYEEWEDPSGGLLTRVFDACENDDGDALEAALDELKASQWGLNAPGPDGDTPL